MKGALIRSVSAFALAASTMAVGGETVTYKYDALGRLVLSSVSGGPAVGVASTYDYDPAGNRTQVRVGGVPTPAPSPTPTPVPTPTPTGGPATVASTSFESPVVSNYAYRPNVPGVTFVDAAGIATNGGAFSFPGTSDGNQAGFMAAERAGTTTGSGSIQETLSGLTPGVNYQVTFKAVNRPGYVPARIQLSAGGYVIADVSAPSGWTTYLSSAFTATASTMTVTFAAVKVNGDSASAVDAIQVVAAAAPTSGVVASASFESPAVDSHKYAPSVSGVTFGGNAGIAANGGAFNFPATSDGNQAGFTQTPSGAITEMVTGLTVGASYKVVFKAVSRPGYSGPRQQVIVGGSVLLDYGASASWTTYTSGSFTATGSSVNVTFQAIQQGDDGTTAIDTVQVVPQ